MADKISELPEVTTLADADLIPVVAGGVTSKIQKSNFAIATGIPAVNTFADLPAAASYTDKIYRVKTTTGAWYTFDKKSSGIYQSNGTIWVLQPGVMAVADLVDVSIATEPVQGTVLVYDATNNVWKAQTTVTNISEAAQAAITSSAVTTLDWSAGHINISDVSLTLSSIDNIPTGVVAFLTITVWHTTGVRSITWPASQVLSEAAEYAAAGTSGGFDMFRLMSSPVQSGKFFLSRAEKK